MPSATPLSTRRRSYSNPSFGSTSIRLSCISRNHTSICDEHSRSPSQAHAQRELEWRKAEIALTGLMFSQEHDASFLQTGPLAGKLRLSTSLQDLTALSSELQAGSTRNAEKTLCSNRAQTNQGHSPESQKKIIRWFSRGLARRRKPTTPLNYLMQPRQQHNNETKDSSVILIIKPLPPTPSSELPPSPEDISPNIPSTIHPYASLAGQYRAPWIMIPPSPNEVDSLDFPFTVRTATSDVHSPPIASPTIASPTIASSPDEQYTSFWVEDDDCCSDQTDSPRRTKSSMLEVPLTTSQWLDIPPIPMSHPPDTFASSTCSDEGSTAYGSSNLTPRTLMDRSFATIQDQFAPFTLREKIIERRTEG